MGSIKNYKDDIIKSGTVVAKNYEVLKKGYNETRLSFNELRKLLLPMQFANLEKTSTITKGAVLLGDIHHDINITIADHIFNLEDNTLRLLQDMLHYTWFLEYLLERGHKLTESDIKELKDLKEKQKSFFKRLSLDSVGMSLAGPSANWKVEKD